MPTTTDELLAIAIGIAVEGSSTGATHAHVAS